MKKLLLSFLLCFIIFWTSAQTPTYKNSVQLHTEALYVKADQQAQSPVLNYSLIYAKRLAESCCSVAVSTQPAAVVGGGPIPEKMEINSQGAIRNNVLKTSFPFPASWLGVDCPLTTQVARIIRQA